MQFKYCTIQYLMFTKTLYKSSIFNDLFLYFRKPQKTSLKLVMLLMAVWQIEELNNVFLIVPIGHAWEITSYFYLIFFFRNISPNAMFTCNYFYQKNPAPGENVCFFPCQYKYLKYAVTFDFNLTITTLEKTFDQLIEFCIK